MKVRRGTCARGVPCFGDGMLAGVRVVPCFTATCISSCANWGYRDYHAHCAVRQVTRYPPFYISAHGRKTHIMHNMQRVRDMQNQFTPHLGNRSPFSLTTSAHRRRKSFAKPHMPRPPCARKFGEFRCAATRLMRSWNRGTVSFREAHR